MEYTLGLCMIVKNEEDTLSNCLNSIAGIFDEIVIVDTGSTDNTTDIAKLYTDKLFFYEWKDDFADARNFAFEKSTCDYIMWLDADDILTTEDAEKLRNLKYSLDGKITEIAALYNVGFDENGNVTLQYYRERIFLKSAGLKWSGRIHETIPILNTCKYSDFAVTHNKIHPTESGRNLRIFEKMKENGDTFDARNSFYYARELYYNNKIDLAILELNGFLLREDSFLENRINACYVLADCMRKKGFSPLSALFKSFEYDLPRAEICCEIGKYFYETDQRKLAIYWYKEALTKQADNKSGAFILRDCYDFIPLLQLCVLYYADGDINEAIKYNEKASSIKPNDKAVLFNKEFFKKIKNK